MNIAVFAASGDRPDAVYHESAKELGELIASSGHTVIYGGGANGLMGDCAKAALGMNGKVVGIAPRMFDMGEVLLKACTEFIYTDTMAERKGIMEEMADAFVILPGGIGTMEEFFEVYTQKQLGLHSKPIVLLNTNGFYEPIKAYISSASSLGFIGSGCETLIRFSENVSEALDYILKAPRIAGDLKEKLQCYSK